MDKKNTKYLSIIVSFILVFGSLAPVLVLTALAINSPLIEIQNPISESFESDLKVDTAKLGSLQIPFIQNQGQLNEEVKFYVSTFTGTIFVTESELTYSLIGVASDDDTVQEVIILEKFIGSNDDLQPKGFDKSNSIVNYFIGNEENWRYNIPTYNVVRMEETWPSVDVELRAYGNNVEKIFNIQPGGNVEDIKMEIKGITELSVGNDNNAGNNKLWLKTEIGNIFMTNPIAYQDIDGTRTFVDVSYIVDGLSYGFVVGEYDPSYTLVIDPLLASTLIGGSIGYDRGQAIAVDNRGNVFVSGHTQSPDFTGASPSLYVGGNYDVFVSKLDSSLGLIATSFIGGTSTDVESIRITDLNAGIAVDKDGNVFVVGYTKSHDFTGAVGTYNGGESDVYISKLDNSLDFISTNLIGGSQSEGGRDIAIDSNGDVYVTGYTDSPDFTGAAPGSYNNMADVFVSKLDNSLSLIDTMLFGGDFGDQSYGIAIFDSDVFVAGFTDSVVFTGAVGSNDAVNRVAFVTRIDNQFSSIKTTVFSGNFENSWKETNLFDITLDNSGNVFVAGRTTPNSGYDPVVIADGGTFGTGGSYDVLIAKLDRSLNLLASYIIGTIDSEQATGIDVDNNGQVFIIAHVPSDFPTTAGAYDQTFNGGFSDILVAKFDNSLTLMVSTFIGGSGYDNGRDITIDKYGNIFITGYTESRDFPTDYDSYHGGWDDVFVSKLDNDLSSVLQAATIEFDQLEYPLSVNPSITVTDATADRDPAGVDFVSVSVTSSSDLGGINIPLRETGDNTGIFSGIVILTYTDESSGNRLRVSNCDIIQATYKNSVAEATAGTDCNKGAPQSSAPPVSDFFGFLYFANENLSFFVIDSSENQNPNQIEQIQVPIIKYIEGGPFLFNTPAKETGVNTGRFEGSFPASNAPPRIAIKYKMDVPSTGSYGLPGNAEIRCAPDRTIPVPNFNSLSIQWDSDEYFIDECGRFLIYEPNYDPGKGFALFDMKTSNGRGEGTFHSYLLPNNFPEFRNGLYRFSLPFDQHGWQPGDTITVRYKGLSSTTTIQVVAEVQTVTTLCDFSSSKNYIIVYDEKDVYQPGEVITWRSCVQDIANYKGQKLQTSWVQPSGVVNTPGEVTINDSIISQNGYTMTQDVPNSQGTWKLHGTVGPITFDKIIQIGAPITTVPLKQIIVPSWIKTNAGWWAGGQIKDDSFVEGIKYLIKEDIMRIPETKAGTGTSQEIPPWIKQNAGWWSTGQISDESFVNGIQWLIENGIMKIG